MARSFLLVVAGTVQILLPTGVSHSFLVLDILVIHSGLFKALSNSGVCRS